MTKVRLADISFTGSHKLWAQYVNGTFAQHDLRECFRPLDSIPRVAMSWAACSNLAFVANIQPIVEVPFDDVLVIFSNTIRNCLLTLLHKQPLQYECSFRSASPPQGNE